MRSDIHFQEIPLGFNYEEWIVRGLGTRSVWRLLKTSCCGPVVEGGDGSNLDWSAGCRDGERTELGSVRVKIQKSLGVAQLWE